MAETSLPWGGTVDGDAGPYDDDTWSDVWSALFTYDRTIQGVVNTARVEAGGGFTGLLEVTNPSTSVIRVADGIALVDGKIYYNTANIDETLDVPLTGTNYFTVVLHKDFAAQTVRVDIKEAAGNSNGGASTAVGVPVVTQTDGTTWEISLATITITVGPVVTITDTRYYIGKGGERTVCIPVVQGNTGSGPPTSLDMNTTGYGWDTQDGVASNCYGMWVVPDDFISDLTISVALYAEATADVCGRGYVSYSAAGEAYNTHSDLSVAITVGVVNTIVKEDYEIAVTAASVGDVISIRFIRDATNILDTIGGVVTVRSFVATYISSS